MSIITCCFALSVLAFGVYASLSVSFNLSGKITFDPNGVDAHIETQVFKYNKEITHDDAYLLASDVQANTIEEFNSDADYTKMEDNYISYDTKNGNVYDVEHTMSDLHFDFEDCYAYVIVIHVNPNNDSYDLEAHNQIVFGELTTNTEFPDGAWLAYNDKYLVIYPSAQDDGLNMVLVVGVEQFKEVAETDFTLTLTLSYKEIYVPTEDDEIRQADWDDAEPNDVVIVKQFSWGDEDYYFKEIVLPETVENGAENVVGIICETGDSFLFGNKLILNKNCVSIKTWQYQDNLGIYYEEAIITENIIVDQRNEEMSSLDNVLFNKNKSLLILATNNLTNYTIPSSVNKIYCSAFDNCNDIILKTDEIYGGKYLSSYTNPYFALIYCDDTINTNFVLNKNCKVLVGYALYKSKITSFDFNGADIKEIPFRMFYDCSSLTNITIPDSVTSIGEEAFMDCSSLTDITIPESVTIIERYAFCRMNLNSIYIPASVEIMEEYVFESVNININNSNFKIYCGAAQQPVGWDSDWNTKYVGSSPKWPVQWDMARDDYNRIVNS